MLLAPILTAAAVGFAVSVGQYLPTLLIGGGRVETLTTEAVALAAGGDRRLIGVYALMQTLAPFAGFALALGRSGGWSGAAAEGCGRDGAPCLPALGAARRGSRCLRAI